jgi:hypothetical protein
VLALLSPSWPLGGIATVVDETKLRDRHRNNYRIPNRKDYIITTASPRTFSSSFPRDLYRLRLTFRLRSDLRTRYLCSALFLISHGASPVFSATLALHSALDSTFPSYDHTSRILTYTLTYGLYGLISSQSTNLTVLVETAIACAGYRLRAKPAHCSCDITNHFL